MRLVATLTIALAALLPWWSGPDLSMPRAGSPVVAGTVAPREWKCAHRIAQGTAALLAGHDGRHA